MFFHEKFSYLYRLLNLNHKLVSKHCGYDVSLLSRWKNGNRLPSAKNGQYKELARYFLSAIKTQVQRDEINMIIAGHRAVATHLSDEQDVFEDWLMVSNTKPQIPLMNYTNTSESLSQLRLIMSNQDELAMQPKMSLDTDTRTDVYIYKTNQGKRDAVLYFLSTALELHTPHDLYIFSDEEQEWWLEDPNFPYLWANYLKGLTLKGHRISVIFLITRPSELYVGVLNTWLPLMFLGKVNAFYSPHYTTPSVKSTTFIIKDTLAYVSLSSQHSEFEKIGYLHFDLPSIYMQSALFFGRMTHCRSLVTIYSLETQISLLERMLLTETTDYRMKMFNHFPSPFFLPLSVFERYAQSLPSDMVERYLSIIRKYLKTRENMIASVDVSELIIYKSLKEFILDSEHTLHEGRFFANRLMKLTSQECHTYLDNIITTLSSFPNYHFSLIHRTDMIQDITVNVSVREHVGAVITPMKPSIIQHIAVVSTEGNTVHALFNHLSNIERRTPSVYHYKNEVIQALLELKAMIV